MKRTLELRLLAGLSWALSTAICAQVERPTAEEAQISAIDVPGGAAFKSQGLSAEPGLADPRDFTGTWDNEGNVAGFLALRAAQRKAAEQAGSVPAAAEAPLTGGVDLAALRAQQAPKLSCMPSVGPFSGGDGPVEILQTSAQLTWMAEEMHAIRRVFLGGDFTPGLAPSYNGESIGHFEGDVLVIETRGMKGLPAGARMLERLAKSEQGRVLEDRISFVDAAGRELGNARTLKLYYRPNEKMLEWICEDNGEKYQPGGYDRVL